MKYIIINRHLSNCLDYSSQQWNLRPLHRILEDGERRDFLDAHKVIQEMLERNPFMLPTHVVAWNPGEHEHGIETEINSPAYFEKINFYEKRP